VLLTTKNTEALALEAAHKSIVLLKNEKNTLPLKKDIKNLAVIGPNADQWLMLLGNYNGVPADPITPLRGIREKVKNTKRTLCPGLRVGSWYANVQDHSSTYSIQWN
jgi:beta-glucosidase-like glycosyl hydrolase